MKQFIFIFFPILFLFPDSAYSTTLHTEILSHKIHISIDLESHTIEGTDTIKVSGNREEELRLFLRKDSEIMAVTEEGKPLSFHISKDPGKEIKEIFIEPLKKKASFITIHYKARFLDPSMVMYNSVRGVTFTQDGVIGKEGVFLSPSSLWYPQGEERTSSFEISVETSKGYETVTEGERIERRVQGNGAVTIWRSETPLKGLNLVVGQYIVTEEMFKNVLIMTYLFPEDQDLSERYIEGVKRYLELYEGLLGPYPFKKFAVVENFLPTGYGMSSFTLLGRTVMRLPFIVGTSLGHEVAHSWWGNSVYPDSASGNWTEALTTYLADYLYKEQKGEKEAREFRKETLEKYSNYAKDGTSMALKEFRNPTDPQARAVGYNKGAMVFHMIRRLVGDEPFFKALRDIYREKRFKRASWKDFEEGFEKALRQSRGIQKSDLSWFFKQWVERPGGPTLKLGKTVIEKVEPGYKVSFELLQSTPPYILDLPVSIETETGRIDRKIRIFRGQERVDLLLSSRPLSLEIDPEYHIFRILSEDEMPPTLHRMFGDREGVIVLPTSVKGTFQEGYSALGDLLSRNLGLKKVEDRDLALKERKENNLFILGWPEENSTLKTVKDHLPSEVMISPFSFKVSGKEYRRGEAFIVVILKSPFNPSKVIGLILGGWGPEEMVSSGRRILHFGKYSYLVFKRDGGLSRGVFEGEKVLGHTFKDNSD